METKTKDTSGRVTISSKTETLSLELFCRIIRIYVITQYYQH